MIDEAHEIQTDPVVRESRVALLEMRVGRLEALLSMASRATAAGFDDAEFRLQALELAVFGKKVNGFDGAGEAERPPAIIPSRTSA